MGTASLKCGMESDALNDPEEALCRSRRGYCVRCQARTHHARARTF
jgi:hypothetical protein